MYRVTSYSNICLQGDTHLLANICLQGNICLPGHWLEQHLSAGQYLSIWSLWLKQHLSAGQHLSESKICLQCNICLQHITCLVQYLHCMVID